MFLEKKPRKNKEEITIEFLKSLVEREDWKTLS